MLLFDIAWEKDKFWGVRLPFAFFFTITFLLKISQFEIMVSPSSIIIYMKNIIRSKNFDFKILIWKTSEIHFCFFFFNNQDRLKKKKVLFLSVGFESSSILVETSIACFKIAITRINICGLSQLLCLGLYWYKSTNVGGRIHFLQNKVNLRQCRMVSK